MTESKNLLYLESSPYLLQHADNPVHWMAWNRDSLELARSSGKPILLSIGYSACHWCHVMARESFDDEETAELMNRLFINIKVDREERPDLDKIYQNAHSLLTHRAGGWPLTVFLTPDSHMPVFAGTYFPVEARHGLPAFKTLLQNIDHIWQTRQSDIAQQSDALQSAYQHIYELTKPDDSGLNHTVIDIARKQIRQQFDELNGGFSDAPKFPHPTILEFSIKHWAYTKKAGSTECQADNESLHYALFSLQKMAEGGLFDHLGGGFYRYSTDRLWMIPHFEKMLYDNGPLLSLYSQAWKISGDFLFQDAAIETAAWVIREMQSPQGGYYSSQDADSEGMEGRFFIWNQHEINIPLETIRMQSGADKATIDLFRKRFGLDQAANFKNYWHLHAYHSIPGLAGQYRQHEQSLRERFTVIRQHLFKHREKRSHPHTDRKILSSWNGLMIQGMAMAGRLLDRPEYTESAFRSAHFLKNNCWKNRQLYACYTDGIAGFPAYLDDYSFIIQGILELLQNRWDDSLYQWSLELADRLLADFEDTGYGGFFYTSHQHENLIQRPKSFSDDAIASGNGIAALALNRLGYLSGDTRYNSAAVNCLQSALQSINQSPVSHCAILNAVNESLDPPELLIMRTVDSDTDSWQTLTRQYYLPFTMIYTIPIGSIPPNSVSVKKVAKQSLAYPCSGMSCNNPLQTERELDTYLRNNSYRIAE